MSDNKFKDYLSSRQWGAKQSVFVDRALTSYTLSDPGSWEDLKEELEHHGADKRIIEEAEYIWGLYVADTRGKAD